MSGALRDERVDVYSYAQSDTDGRTSSAYTLAGTYWSRRSSPGAREATIAGQASQRIDAVFTFSNEVTIPGDGALRHSDGKYYKVTGVMPVRGTNETEQIVLAQYADEQSMTTTP